MLVAAIVDVLVAGCVAVAITVWVAVRVCEAGPVDVAVAVNTGVPVADCVPVALGCTVLVGPVVSVTDGKTAVSVAVDITGSVAVAWAAVELAVMVIVGVGG